MVVGENRGWIAEHRLPHGRRQDHQHDRADEPGEAAPQRTPGGEPLPIHREEQHREIGRSRDAERKRDEERQILSISDRKSTRLNSSHLGISYAVFCLKKKKKKTPNKRKQA